MRKTAFTSAPNEVAELLKEAMGQGRLVILRTSTVPPNAEASLLAALNLLFKLTATEGRALVELMEHQHVSREALHAAMARDGNPISQLKTIDVVIHKLRKKLKPYGIDISTIWGSGFALAESGRDKIQKILAGFGEDAAAAVTPSAEPAAAPSD
jgi:hypothetical protein